MIFQTLKLWKPTEDTEEVIIRLENQEEEIILCVAIEYTSSFSFKVQEDLKVWLKTEEQ